MAKTRKELIDATMAATAARVFQRPPDQEKKLEQPDRARELLEKKRQLEPYDFVNDPNRRQIAATLFAAREGILASLRSYQQQLRTMDPRSPEAQKIISLISSLSNQLAGNKQDFATSLPGATTTRRIQHKPAGPIDKSLRGTALGSTAHKLGIIHPGGVKVEKTETRVEDVDTGRLETQEAVARQETQRISSQAGKTRAGILSGEGKPLSPEVEARVEQKITKSAAADDTKKRTAVAYNVLTSEGSAGDLSLAEEQVATIRDSPLAPKAQKDFEEAALRLDESQLVKLETPGDVTSSVIDAATETVAPTVDELKGDASISMYHVQGDIGKLRRQIDTAVTAEQKASDVVEGVSTGRVGGAEASKQLSELSTQPAESISEGTRQKISEAQASLKLGPQVMEAAAHYSKITSERVAELSETLEFLNHPDQKMKLHLQPKDLNQIALLSEQAGGAHPIAVVAAAAQVSEGLSQKGEEHYPSEVIQQDNEHIAEVRAAAADLNQRFKTELVLSRRPKNPEDWLKWLEQVVGETEVGQQRKAA